MSTPHLAVQLYTRTFAPSIAPVGLRLAVQRYSWAAIGGPKACEIMVTGSPEALWKTAEWLRYSVEVLDHRGERVWWGYIAEVAISVGAFDVGVSLDSMANSVAVAYAAVVAGDTGPGERQTTSYAQNDESVAEYGIKQALLSIGDATSEAAVAFRDAALQIGKFPIPTIARSSGRGAHATITCRGWWTTLDWKYYAQLAETFVNPGGWAVMTGLAMSPNANPLLDYRKIAQAVVMSSSFGVGSVTVRLKRIGNPTVILRVSLYSSHTPLGNPQPLAEIAYGTLDPDEIRADFVDLTVPLTAPVAVTAGTTYYIQLDATAGGTYDEINQYAVEVYDTTPTTYPATLLIHYTGSNWGTIPSRNLQYTLGGLRYTTYYMQQALDVAQFFNDVLIETQSGIYTNGYQDGDSAALPVVEEWLKMGTMGALRLLVRVEPNRDVVVYQEPAQNTISYLIDSYGDVVTTIGIPVPRWTCPVGVWARLKDVIPASSSFTVIADPSTVFIEEAEYDVVNDVVTLSPRGQPTVWDLTALK